MIILYLIVPSLLLGLLSACSLDPDFGWHIFLGQKMVETKTLISDFVGYGNFQKLPINDHEWLSNILLYQIHHSLGYASLIAIFFFLFLITFFLVYKLCIKNLCSKEASITVLSLLFLPYFVIYGVRLQIIILLGAIGLIYIAKYTTRISIKLWFYFMIFTLGINLHGGFLMLGLIPVLLELKFENNHRLIPTRKSVLMSLSVAFIILLCSFITPYGLEFWKLALQYSQDKFYATKIYEWLPIYSPPFNMLIAFHISMTAFCFTAAKCWKKITAAEGLMILIFLYLGVRYTRFYALFAIVSAPLLAIAIDNLFIDMKKNVAKSILKKMSLVLAIFVTLLMLKAINFNPLLRNSGMDLSAAIHHLNENSPQSGNLLNDYDLGGYLLWKNSSRAVFIDGRAPFVKAASGRSILEEYYDLFSKDSSTVKTQLDKYDISSIFIKKPAPDEIKDNYRTNLINYLDSNSDWRKSYQDDFVLIYFRK